MCLARELVASDNEYFSCEAIACVDDPYSCGLTTPLLARWADFWVGRRANRFTWLVDKDGFCKSPASKKLRLSMFDALLQEDWEECKKLRRALRKNLINFMASDDY